MLINKQGKMLANNSQVTKVFDTQAAFNAWVAGKSDKDLSKFIIVKQYEYAIGTYVEVQNQTELNSLPDYNKKTGVLYASRADNKLYRFDFNTKELIIYKIIQLLFIKCQEY